MNEKKLLDNIFILSAGYCLPKNKVSNQKLAEIFSINEEWLEIFIGNKSRYYAYDFDDNTVTQSLTDISEMAALKALEKSYIQLSDIDGLILSTATPDNLMPSTANLVASRLGLNNIATFQIQSGCCGAIQAIDLGAKLLMSNMHKNLLIIGGDSCYKFFNSNINLTEISPEELINYALFGDGAGALILSSQDVKNSLSIKGVVNEFVGRELAPGQTINWIGQDAINKEYQALSEDYKAIEKNVPTMSQEILETILNLEKANIDDVQYYLPPQLSENMTKRIIDKLGISKNHSINIVSEVSNNGNAIPFIQITKLFEKIKMGEKAICITVESSKWTKGGILLYAN